MYDQASTLREVVRASSLQPLDALAGHQPVAIAITSGKGGVGKTNVVANVAVALAKMGKRVLILDADFGLANIWLQSTTWETSFSATRLWKRLSSKGPTA